MSIQTLKKKNRDEIKTLSKKGKVTVYIHQRIARGIAHIRKL